MLRDINYQLMPELTFEGKELRRVKLFLNHWSFHKVDKVQGRASEINLVGAEFRVSPAFSKNGDDYVFFQIRTQILHNSALKNERPLARDHKIEIGEGESQDEKRDCGVSSAERNEKTKGSERLCVAAEPDRDWVNRESRIPNWSSI